MPVPVLLISGACAMTTPVALVRDWIPQVEALRGKQMVVFDASGHAPFVSKTEHFVKTARGFGVEVVGAGGE